MPPAAIEVKPITDTQGIILPPPTTLPQKQNDLYSRRQTADNEPRTRWGTAAFASSALFRSPHTNSKSKPKAKRWDDLLTAESLARKGSSLKGAARLLSTPGLISLGGGLPSSTYFPFSNLQVSVPSAPNFGEDSSDLPTALSAGKNDLVTGESIFDISTAFNYGQGSGSAQLLRWVTEHTELVHKPPYQDWECNLTIGSTSAIDMAFRMFARPGDSVLTEEYTFPTAIEAAVPMGLKMVGVEIDEQGLIPEEFDAILTNWESDHPGQRKPKLLYTVPTGQNPTGATMGTQRRRDIYALCQKHDIFILEDEPYYFLQMPDYGSPSSQGPMNHQDFLKSLTPSFLSMDVDGRVMRMDSFSKVVAPGSRVGWITASEQVVERYRIHVDCSTQGPSGMSQLILFKVLEEHWGHGGYLDWLKHIQKEYTARRDAICDSCERHLPKDILRWSPPKAGMFHWIEVDWKEHPLAESWSLVDIEEQIFMASVNHGSLVTRSSWFYADTEKEQTRMFFRATYAAAPFDKIDAAIERFGEAVREVFGLRNPIEVA